MTDKPVETKPGVFVAPRSTSIFSTDKLDQVIQAERESSEKIHASVEASPDGLEASASVDVGTHAQAGGFVRRGWNGIKSWGARFTFSK